MNLSSTIKSIQDIMRKDDGVDGDAQRLGQLTWMLFLKVFDQREVEWEDDAQDQGKTYRSPLPDRYRWRHWAASVPGKDGKKAPQKSPTEIIGFVNNELFPALKDLDANASPQHKVIRNVFEDANNYMKSGPQLLAVIEKLEEAIHFDDFKDRAQLGDVYEQLLNDLRGAGNAGEFYTPRAITQFMVDRVNPRLDKRDSVIDPACGTGGFLTATIDHFRKESDDLPELFFDVYVVDPSYKPVGAVPVSQLLRVRRDTPLAQIMDQVTEIPVGMDQEEVAYIFDKYHLISAPVIDAGASMAHQRAISPTSSGIATRPSGMSASNFSPPRLAR